jgi:diguanylate cyclase (GGDEF)-like protein
LNLWLATDTQAMASRWALTRDGASLRVRLAPLLALALITVGLSAAAEVNQRIKSVTAASRVHDFIRDAAAIDALRIAASNEIIPSVTVAVVKKPSLMTAASSTAVPLQLYLQADQLAREFAPARARTDAALATLATYPTLRYAIPPLRSSLATTRAALDHPTTLAAALVAAQKFAALSAQFEDDQVSAASGEGVTSGAAQGLRDIDLAARAVQTASSEVLLHGALALSSNADLPVARASWLRGWGDFSAASQAVTERGSKALAADWAAANAKPTVAQLNRLLDAQSQSQSKLDMRSYLQIALQESGRSTAYVSVLNAANTWALTAASRQGESARAALMWLISMTALLLALALTVAFLVGRSVTRSLDLLAKQATDISRGDLVDVSVGGPSEVRVVARALSESVASLRKIEAQAAAVAAGDLDSDVVHAALPGPLGQVVHDSVGRIVRAINERELARDELAHRASHDALTELPNRAQALTLIEHALHRAQRSSAKTGLMFVDLDHFKAVNDNFGHAAGDEVLQSVSRRMLNAVRSGDHVARLGGDEFVVLLEDIDDEADVIKLAHRLIESVSADIAVDGRGVRVGASVGVAFCRDSYVDADRLLQEADAAAYRAKNAGRGRVDVFDDDLRAALHTRAELELAIAAGLEAGEFVLHYQPVIDLATSQTRGFEALIRWNRPGHGLVPPDEFIPVAEQSTLINDIGRWALHQAMNQLALWSTSEPSSRSMNMAVNISGRHLSSSRLLTDVADALAACGLPAHRLVIEITETVLVDDPIATTNMHALRALGAQISLDDFGTGYTSIGQLPKLPVDTLKIDRSFVASTDPAHQELVRLIVGAAHAFGLSVVGEGIENQGQADRLRAANAELAQGFLFARPAAALDQFLGSRARDASAEAAPAELH